MLLHLGWMCGFSKLEKKLVALGYDFGTLTGNIEHKPGPEESLICLGTHLVSPNISAGLIKISPLHTNFMTLIE